METTPHAHVACGGAVPRTTRLTTIMTAPGHLGAGTSAVQRAAGLLEGGVEPIVD